VAQLVGALRYKPADRRFDSRWCYWNCVLQSGSLNLLEFSGPVQGLFTFTFTGKVVLLHGLEAYRRDSVFKRHLFSISVPKVGGKSYAPTVLATGNKKLSDLQSRPRHFAEEKNSLAPCENQTPDRPALYRVVTP
jgi:hypothetical protein